MKPKLCVAFSGGRTSAFMLWWIFHVWEDRHNWEIVVVFANTGKENEGTLEFVERCSVEWNIPVVWIEARHLDDGGNTYSERARRVSFRVVDFKTASRNGEPFEEMISVLGIPSTNAPLCSDQLKTKPTHEYIKSLGWKKYTKAVGIRYDEPKRIKKSESKFPSLWYPVAEHTVMSKWDILTWWKTEQKFDLNIPKGLGNCDNCWKKSTLGLLENTRKYPSTFDWWQSMTDKYGHLNPRDVELKPPFNFYRGNLSPKDLFELAKLSPTEINKISQLEIQFDCSESCEAF